MELTDFTEKAIAEGLFGLAKKHRNLVVLQSDFAGQISFTKFGLSFPERLFHFGLMESNIASVAAGFAIRGKVPFLVGFANVFTQKAWSSINESICLPNFNIKIIGVAEPFRSISDIALMRALPNMKVLCPSSFEEILEAISYAYMEYGPVYIRLSLSVMGQFSGKTAEGEVNSFRNFSVLNEGTDLNVLSFGFMADESLKAAQFLTEKGKSAKVINVRGLKPMHREELLGLLLPGKKCVTVEDHSLIGGLYSAVCEGLGGDGIPVHGFGLPDTFVEDGNMTEICQKYGLDSRSLTEKWLNLLG